MTSTPDSPAASPFDMTRSRGALSVGDPAPDFSLPSSEGGTVRLKDFKGKKIVILYFYPRDDTPGCTREACAFRDDIDQYRKRGAVVLGVSADDLDDHARFIQKFRLPFPLLADTEKKVLADYGVFRQKSLYGRKFMGIVRTTIVIDKRGRIARIFPKVQVDGHSAEILAFLDNPSS